MRRSIFPAIATFLALLPLFGAAARAQEATPASSDLSAYPKLSITITADAYLLDSQSVAAGWVVLSATNQTDEDTGILALGPQEGMTGDQLEQLASTPEPSGEIPAWLFSAVVAGGPSGIMPGETLEAIVHLPAGDWAISGEGSQPATRFTTVDGPDSVTTEPTATMSMDLGDFYFGGIDKGLLAGPQLLKFSNSGEQPHMVILAKGPDAMTTEQVMAAATLPDDATPEPGGLQESDLTFIPGVTLISSGQSMYVPVNLEPGTYLAICFVTDPATGNLHAMEGMLTTFTVS